MIRRAIVRKDFDLVKEDIWFRNSSVGKNKICQTYKDLGDIIGNDEFLKVTGHAGRACLITYSLSNGVTPRAVMQQSRHRSVLSMQPYDRQSQHGDTIFQDVLAGKHRKKTTHPKDPLPIQVIDTSVSTFQSSEFSTNQKKKRESETPQDNVPIAKKKKNCEVVCDDDDDDDDDVDDDDDDVEQACDSALQNLLKKQSKQLSKQQAEIVLLKTQQLPYQYPHLPPSYFAPPQPPVLPYYHPSPYQHRSTPYHHPSAPYQHPPTPPYQHPPSPYLYPQPTHPFLPPTPHQQPSYPSAPTPYQQQPSYPSAGFENTQMRTVLDNDEKKKKKCVIM